MRKNKIPSDVSSYRKICDEYCLLLKDAKTKYYTELILNCEGDSKKLFRVVNSLCKERSVNLLPPLQKADDFHWTVVVYLTAGRLQLSYH